MFTDRQKQLLEGKLDPDVVKKRPGPNGRQLSYVEGWLLIEVANEIFGHGNWSAETVELLREHEPVVIPPSEEHPRGGVVVTYSARVRLTVHSEDHSKKIVRERTGAHRGFGLTVGQAIEDCCKSAETDALKRCFVTFGAPLGLALYDPQQRNVGKEPKRIEAGQERPLAPIDQGFDQAEPQPRQPVSQRALASSRSPPARPNGKDRGPLPY